MKMSAFFVEIMPDGLCKDRFRRLALWKASLVFMKDGLLSCRKHAFVLPETAFCMPEYGLSSWLRAAFLPFLAVFLMRIYGSCACKCLSDKLLAMHSNGPFICGLTAENSRRSCSWSVKEKQSESRYGWKMEKWYFTVVVGRGGGVAHRKWK